MSEAVKAFVKALRDAGLPEIVFEHSTNRDLGLTARRDLGRAAGA